MTVLKAAALAAFMRHPSAEIVCVLVHGDDAGAVRETASAIVAAVAGSLDDPFSVARLSEQALARDPGLLADEFAAIAHLGGRRAVWVSEAGAAFIKAVEPLLAQKAGGNLIVAESVGLQKSSRLRIVCETSPAAAVIPLYEQNERDIDALVGTTLRAAGLAITDEARMRLVSLLGGGRLDARQQLAKLVSYCLGQPEIGMADVEACCGDSTEFSSDDLLDAALDGNLEETERHYARLVAAGTSGTSLLSAAGFYVSRLQRMRIRVDRGDGVDAAIRSARPPVFYSRQPTVTRQLQLWDSEALAGLAASIAGSTLQCRGHAALEAAIASRAFLSAARAARSRRAAR